MNDADMRAARVAGRTYSFDHGRAPINWSRPIYGYLALAIAALALGFVGLSCLG